MTRGIPGSGKSTFARSFVRENDNWKRVNKDELRAMIDCGKKGNEKTIIEAETVLIETFISKGNNIIIDNTHIPPENEKRLRIMAMKHGYEFEVKEFLTDIDTCIARDMEREGDACVGENVIRRFYNEYNDNKRNGAYQFVSS